MTTIEMNPIYDHLSSNLESLIALLVDHPNMTPEVTLEPQPKNKIQFMYDFLTRTRNDLTNVDPSIPESQQEKWNEVLQRAMFAQILINDQPEKLSQMTQEKEGEKLDFGETIRKSASKLVPTNAYGQSDGEDGESAVS